MPGQLSSYALDIYVAPELSSLGTCGALDLSELKTQSIGWVTTFPLVSMLQFNFELRVRQHIFNILRRAEAAIEEHEIARSALAEYVAGPRNTISRYFLAVRRFEGCVAQLYQGFMLVRSLLGAGNLFERGDNSSLERLNLVYNRAKHAEKAIAAGQLPPDGTISMWITNTGLKTTDGELTFDELADLLRAIARQASLLANPGEALKRYQEQLAKSGDSAEGGV